MVNDDIIEYQLFNTREPTCRLPQQLPLFVPCAVQLNDPSLSGNHAYPTEIEEQQPQFVDIPDIILVSQGNPIDIRWNQCHDSFKVFVESDP